MFLHYLTNSKQRATNQLAYIFALMTVFCIGIAIIGVTLPVIVEWKLLIAMFLISVAGIVVLEWYFPGNGNRILALFSGVFDGGLISVFIGTLVFAYLFVWTVCYLAYLAIKSVVLLF